MFYISLSTLFLLIGALVIDRSRLRESLPIGLASIVLSGVWMALPYRDAPFSLVDTGPVTDAWAVMLLLQLTVAPVQGIWYMQGVVRGGPFPWVRTALFVVMGACVYSLQLSAGRIQLAPWATPIPGLILDRVLFFAALWQLDRVISGTASAKPRRWLRVLRRQEPR